MLRNFVTATVRITRSSRQKVEATVRQGSFSESDDSTSDEESSEEEEGYVDLKTLAAQSDLPNEFWYKHQNCRLVDIRSRGRGFDSQGTLFWWNIRKSNAFVDRKDGN